MTDGYYRTEYKYHKLNEIKSKKSYFLNENGKDAVYEIRYEFDERGIESKETKYDGDGNIIETDGYATEEFEVNICNLCTKKTRLDKNGNWADSDFAVLEYTYDDLGRCISHKTYVNDNGKLSMSYSDEIEYDSYGGEKNILFMIVAET